MKTNIYQLSNITLISADKFCIALFKELIKIQTNKAYYDWDITIYPTNGQVMYNTRKFILAITKAGEEFFNSLDKIIRKLLKESKISYIVQKKLKKD